MQTGRLFYAPWRDDPRPIEALLQGAYAHLGVTDYWRARRHRAEGPDAVAAAERFARWRALTAEAIDTLADSGALTDRGDRVVARMRATVEPWLGEPVDPPPPTARRWAAERRRGWERRRQIVSPLRHQPRRQRPAPAGDRGTHRPGPAGTRRRGGADPLVNASLSSIGWVQGGAPAVVAALREAVGPAGTVVMPAGTEENSNFSRAHRERIAGMSWDQLKGVPQPDARVRQAHHA